MDFPGGSDGNVSFYNAGDLGSIPGLGRSLAEGNGNPLQYYCLGNPMDRGAGRATAHRVMSHNFAHMNPIHRTENTAALAPRDTRRNSQILRVLP